MKNILIRNFYFLILLAIVSSCSTRFYEPTYCQLSDRIVDPYIENLKNSEGLLYCGGGGAFMNNVKQISLLFACYRTLQINEAREFYISVVENLRDKVNSNLAIRPYLDQYPFEWNNLDIGILFLDSDNDFCKEGVASVGMGKSGQIVYNGYGEDGLFALCRETPEEAIALAHR